MDITRAADWESLLGLRRADALLAEHVWEHLPEEQTALANRHCHVFLKPGGHLRLAVADSLHPDPVYRENVRPGGVGPGAGDHKLLYDYHLLRSRLEATGFEVRLLEYWDESGQFHYMDWDSADGHISHSRRYDKRNRSASLAYTSLIVDAVKPR